MRFHVISDLHQEFGEVDVPHVACDAVICAGDVSIKRSGLKWILRRFPDVPVVYICGNHEFYGENYPSLISKLRDEARNTNVHVLENEHVILGGVPVFGCTLWTDLALQGPWPEGAAFAGEIMNDYKRVRNSLRGYRRLSPADTRKAHFSSLDAMRRFFTAHDPRHSIVVTHHAPSALSLPEDRRDKSISCAYASHLDAFILEHQPQVWVHGHIHHHQDYRIGSTRILSNPRAYPDSPNPGFIPDLVIEVSPPLS
ncbi:MAG TPA: metallophosphoesterase [Verrucomicrobiales bacterium]|jgi:predicted phosphodiesterase|nr:metallophosphoesterase [Verrucomicrobiales bacterium]